MFSPFSFIALCVLALVSVAFITLLERKLLSIIGFRVGPNKVSIFGILQPISDAVKLSNKSINFLTSFSSSFYYLSSVLMIISSLMVWACSSLSSDFKLAFLFIAFFLGLNSIGSVICGWCSFSKYSLMGSLRTVSQLISYEAVLFICFFFFFISFFSFNLLTFFDFEVLLFFSISPFCFIFWVPTVLAELNRTPYDFSEGESELVSGFNTEFGSSSFTLIFLSEYSNIIFFSVLTSFLFFSSPMVLFFFFFFFFFCYLGPFFTPAFPFRSFDSPLLKILYPFSYYFYNLISNFFVLVSSFSSNLLVFSKHFFKAFKHLML